MNLVIFPLFSAPPRLDGHKIAEVLGQRHKKLKFASSSDSKDKDIFTIKVGKVSVIVSPISQPIPGDDVSGLDEFSRLGWNAAITPESHTAHAIVVGTGGDAKSVSVALTIVAAELCRDDKCLGVFWGPSRVLAHRDFFVEAAEGVAADAPAIWLWVNAHPYRSEGGIGLTTQGLSTYIDRELHFLPHRSHELDDLFGRASNFSDYLYRNGPVVKDGQSLGYSETDIYRARWSEEPSQGEQTTKWIELRVESAKAK